MSVQPPRGSNFPHYKFGIPCPTLAIYDFPLFVMTSLQLRAALDIREGLFENGNDGTTWHGSMSFMPLISTLQQTYYLIFQLVKAKPQIRENLSKILLEDGTLLVFENSKLKEIHTIYTSLYYSTNHTSTITSTRSNIFRNIHS